MPFVSLQALSNTNRSSFILEQSWWKTSHNLVRKKLVESTITVWVRTKLVDTTFPIWVTTLCWCGATKHVQAMPFVSRIKNSLTSYTDTHVSVISDRMQVEMWIRRAGQECLALAGVDSDVQMLTVLGNK